MCSENSAGVILASFQQRDLHPGFGELLGGPTARCAGTNDNGVKHRFRHIAPAYHDPSLW